MAYRTMYEIEVQHDGLNKYRHIRGSDPHVVEQKAEAQARVWDEMWEKRQAAEHKKRQREANAQEKEQKKRLAIEKTREAQEDIDQLHRILLHTLNIDDTVDWDSLLDTSAFPESRPAKTARRWFFENPCARCFNVLAQYSRFSV